MAQNIYDDPAFFAGYSEFRRSREGLSGTSEWPALRALLPAVAGKRVLELGCGFGQLSRWLAAEGASLVLGVDLSEKMLARAVAETNSAVVGYECGDLERVEFDPLAYDLVVSSMALHYVDKFDRLVRAVHAALVPGGDFVFSVEHPLYAARAEPEWLTAANGRKAFAVTDYGIEGKRVTNWVTDGVVKFHRSIATMLNALRDAGFTYVALDEWKPSEAQLDAHPEWRETELVRPMFLLIAVRKPGIAEP